MKQTGIDLQDFEKLSFELQKAEEGWRRAFREGSIRFYLFLGCFVGALTTVLGLIFIATA